MRAGACAVVQQTLTPEAASVLKHSLILARRRGHAQITPLHVAATLLTSTTSTSRLSLFKRACLKSQPFHSRALELCFNVALNRLPTSPTPPLLHTPQPPPQPCLSNALIAALKRAQAHQRRGSIEQHSQQQQQQHPPPLLGVKVELEQLVVSILDDPSVSRVMREAGLSSIDVKKNLDDCLVSSVFQCYNIISSSGGGIYSTPNSPPSGRISSPQNKPLFQTTFSSNDMKLVLDVLLRKNNKKNVVVVGDLLSVTEAFVAELKCKVETGDVPEELKSLHFIRFEIFTSNLKLMRREEVETNISGLKSKIDSLVLDGKGVIIYIGDLKYAVNDDDDEEEEGLMCNKSKNYVVEVIGKLVSCYCKLNVWLMASANYGTYMRCCQQNLDNQWSLQAVHVPSNGLSLTPNAAARFESMSKNAVNNTEKELFNTTCCGECALHYEKELSLNNNKLPNDLPYWLKPPQNYFKDESMDLKRKWSKICQTLHKGSSRDNQNQNQNQMILPSLNNHGYFGNNSSHPCWPKGIPDAKSISFAGSSFNPNPNSHSVPRFRRQQSCHIEFNFTNANHKTKQDVVPNFNSLKEDKEENITLALGSSFISGSRMQNATDMCEMLQEYVPWQYEIIPSVVQVLLGSERSVKKDTWLLINGNDNVGKIRLAFGIAKTVLGSADSILEFRTRNRGSSARCWVETLENALKHRDKVVVFVEDVDLADPEFLKFLSDICQFGTSSCRTIFVLTRCAVLEPESSGSSALSADNKRKAEWDFSSSGKSTRREGMEYVQNGGIDTKQLSSNALDLNRKADEEQQNPLGFLEFIKNTFFFNRDFTKNNYM